MMDSQARHRHQWGEVEKCYAKYGRKFVERIAFLYDKNKETHIPLDIRSAFADCIEDKDWQSITDDEVTAHFEDLMDLLRGKMEGAETLVEKLKWKDHVEHMQDTFANRPRHYAEQIRNGLEKEKVLIDSCLQSDELTHTTDVQMEDDSLKDSDGIKYQLNEVHGKLENFKASVEATNSKAVIFLQQGVEAREKFNSYGVEIKRNTPGSNLAHLESKKNEYCQLFNQYQNNFLLSKRVSETAMAALFTSIDSLFSKLHEATDDYRQNYKLFIAGVHTSPGGRVNILNNLCTQANELFLKSIAQIDRLIETIKSLTNQAETVSCANDSRQKLLDLFGSYLQKTLLVEMSKQILKVTTERSPQFRADFRILGGAKLGFDTGDCGKVAAKVYKSDAMDKLKQGQDANAFCKLENGEKTIEVTNLECVAKFDKLRLASVRDRNQALRANREELVCEQQYQIVFIVKVPIKGMTFTLMAESLIFSIISNPSQEIAARGHLTWQAVFPNEPQVPWCRIALMLKQLFWIQTGRGLNDRNLEYLVGRLFASQHKPINVDLSSEMVAYEHFVKKPMWDRKRSFSFWKWISCCINTVAKDKGPAYRDWINNGVIQGFVARDDVANTLKYADPGTVIIRFSESTIDNDSGGASPYAALNVGLRYVNTGKDIDDVYFTMEALNPKVTDSYKLKTRGLGHILKNYIAKGDQGRLITQIYPNITLDQAFNDCAAPSVHAMGEEDWQSGPLTACSHAIHLDKGVGHFAHMASENGASNFPQPSPAQSEPMPSPEQAPISPPSVPMFSDDTPWPQEFIELSSNDPIPDAQALELLTLHNLLPQNSSLPLNICMPP